MYTYAPGTLPAVMERWAEKVPGRIALSPLVGAWYSELGGLNKWCHIWAYKDAGERGAHPRRGGGQGRLAAGRAAGRAAEAGEHAGGAGRVLAAEVGAASGTFHALPPAASNPSCGRRFMFPLIAIAGVISAVVSVAKGASWLSDKLGIVQVRGLGWRQGHGEAADGRQVFPRSRRRSRHKLPGRPCREAASDRAGKEPDTVRHGAADPRHRLRFARPDATPAWRPTAISASITATAPGATRPPGADDDKPVTQS